MLPLANDVLLRINDIALGVNVSLLYLPAARYIATQFYLPYTK